MDFILASHYFGWGVRFFLKNILSLCLFQIKYYFCDVIFSLLINSLTPSEVCVY